MDTKKMMVCVLVMMVLIATSCKAQHVDDDSEEAKALDKRRAMSDKVFKREFAAAGAGGGAALGGLGLAALLAARALRGRAPGLLVVILVFVLLVLRHIHQPFTFLFPDERQCDVQRDSIVESSYAARDLRRSLFRAPGLAGRDLRRSLFRAPGLADRDLRRGGGGGNT